MNAARLSVLLACALPLLAAPPRIRQLEHVIKPDLPSASAVLLHGKNLIAFGDDSPFQFRLDSHFNITAKTLIKDYPMGPDGRIPKKVKPDFECATFVSQGEKRQILVLGSGSKSVIREVAFLVSPDGRTKTEYSTSALMAQLAAKAGVPAGTPLNLEGLASTGSELLLLNRGNSGPNMVFRVKTREFIEVLQGKRKALGTLRTYAFKLPSIEKYEAGLSGAEVHGGNLYFTASVEVTGDPILDGTILGSFIGCVPLLDIRNGMDLSPYMSLVTKADGTTPLITKLESIVVKGEGEGDVEAILAADLDNGTSEFFRFQITPAE